jgi:hypothetical protein
MRKRIEGIVCFQHMSGALDAAIALHEAGFETKIDQDAIDLYSDAAFMTVWREVECDADTSTMEGFLSPAATAAINAFDAHVIALVDPFEGDCIEMGFSDGPARPPGWNNPQ